MAFRCGQISTPISFGETNNEIKKSFTLKKMSIHDLRKKCRFKAKNWAEFRKNMAKAKTAQPLN